MIKRHYPEYAYITSIVLHHGSEISRKAYEEEVSQVVAQRKGAAIVKARAKEVRRAAIAGECQRSTNTHYWARPSGLDRTEHSGPRRVGSSTIFLTVQGCSSSALQRPRRCAPWADWDSDMAKFDEFERLCSRLIYDGRFALSPGCVRHQQWRRCPALADCIAAISSSPSSRVSSTTRDWFPSKDESEPSASFMRYAIRRRVVAHCGRQIDASMWRARCRVGREPTRRLGLA